MDQIEGTLEAAARFKPGTIQNIDDLSRDQIATPSLGEKSYLTGDIALYYVDQGQPMVALARGTPERPNLIFAHLGDNPSSYYLLRQTDSFRPDPEEVRAAIEAADTLRIPLYQLRMFLDNGHQLGHASLYIDVEGGMHLPRDHPDVQSARDQMAWTIPPNPIERQLFDRVGYTPDFLQVLRRAIGGSSVWSTSVSLRDPRFVLHEAAERPIAYVVTRADFKESFGFTNAAVGYESNRTNVMRGELFEDQ